MAHTWVLLSLICAFALATSDALTKKTLVRSNEYLAAWFRLVFSLPLASSAVDCCPDAETRFRLLYCLYSFASARNSGYDPIRKGAEDFSSQPDAAVSIPHPGSPYRCLLSNPRRKGIIAGQYRHCGSRGRRIYAAHPRNTKRVMDAF